MSTNHRSDYQFSRTHHDNMIRSFLGGQDAKQKKAVAEHEAREQEKADRLAALQIPQPKVQTIASRFKKRFHDKPAQGGRRAFVPLQPPKPPNEHSKQ